MFISVFFDLINTFAKNFKPGLFFLAFLSSIAAAFEFAGLALIYYFVLFLSQGENADFNNKFALLNYFSSQNHTKTALLLGISIALVYILKDIFMIFYMKFQSFILSKLTGCIFEKYYRAFLVSSPILSAKIKNSDKIKILDESINNIVWYFCSKIITLSANIVIALFIAAYLFIKFKMSAFILAGFIFAIWFFENIYFKSQAKKYGTLTLESKRKKMEFVIPTIECAKDAIIYGKEKEFTKTASNLHNNCVKHYKNIITNEALPTYFTEIGIMCALGLLIALLFIKDSSGASLIAGLATITAIILRIVPTINRTQSCLHNINAFKDEARWLIDTYKTLDTQNAAAADEKKIEFRQSITLKNVNFSYNNSDCALKNINLHIKKGDFIGIIGSSGSGKSTLFNILCAIYKPKSGEIFIDNKKLEPKHFRDWQNNISILWQNYCLPFETTGQNTALCKKYDTWEEQKIIAALKSAGVWQETGCNLSKKTQELSEGQKHRIALARAFYYNRDIIMLDEATSSLDVQNEDEIQKCIASIKGKKTIILIAHRLKTLKDCDYLIYMKDGKVVDTGSFCELEQKYSEFKKMVELSHF